MNNYFTNCWLWFKKQSPVGFKKKLHPQWHLWMVRGWMALLGHPWERGVANMENWAVRSARETWSWQLEAVVAAHDTGLCSVTDPPLEAILYFPSMTVPKHPACVWGRCDWFSPLHWFLGGDCQHFTSVYKTSTKLTHSGTGTVLLTVRSRGICRSSCCATLWLSSPSHGSWWQIRWTGAFSTSTLGCSAAIFCVCGEFWQRSTRLFTNREGKNNSSDSPLTLIACIKLSQTTCLLEAAQLIIWSKN